jgi:5-methylcytosine-specific restriction endonuclease McrA
MTNATTKICEKCNIAITSNNFKKHHEKCDGSGRKEDKLRKAKEERDRSGYTCNKCKKEHSSVMSLVAHKRFCSRSFESLGRDQRRRWLIEHSGYACTQCGFNKTRDNDQSILEINHIDGDHTNNTRENLRVLCPNCHALTHNFRNWGRTSKHKTSKRLRKGNKDFIPSSKIDN